MSLADAVLWLCGGLTLFLYAMAQLSQSLRTAAGERMKSMLARLTANPLAGVATGCAATIVLDSSSVTIILVIALVHAGALTFEQSLGVILGSNIGTTVSSMVYAIEVDRYSPVLLAAGLLVLIVRRSKRGEDAGRVIFFIGMLLFGLRVMGESMKPLAAGGELESWLRGLENPLSGALFGAAATAVIQSSSAMMGIVIKMAAAELIRLPAGIAVMLGAEIGTCLDTLLASIGRSREAVRAGVFHLVFNVVSVAVGLVFYRHIADAAVWLAGAGAARQIAAAHVFFNVAGVLLAFPLLPLASGALCILIPSRHRDLEPEEQPEPA